MAGATGSSEAVTTGVLAAMSAVEGAVDAELQRLENMDEEGLGRLREERLQQMQRDAKQVLVLCCDVTSSHSTCLWGTA